MPRPVTSLTERQQRGSHALLLAIDGHYAQMWRLQQQEQRDAVAVDAQLQMAMPQP